MITGRRRNNNIYLPVVYLFHQLVVENATAVAVLHLVLPSLQHHNYGTCPAELALVLPAIPPSWSSLVSLSVSDTSETLTTTRLRLRRKQIRLPQRQSVPSFDFTCVFYSKNWIRSKREKIFIRYQFKRWK